MSCFCHCTAISSRAAERPRACEWTDIQALEHNDELLPSHLRKQLHKRSRNKLRVAAHHTYIYLTDTGLHCVTSQPKLNSLGYFTHHAGTGAWVMFCLHLRVEGKGKGKGGETRVVFEAEASGGEVRQVTQ